MKGGGQELRSKTTTCRVINGTMTYFVLQNMHLLEQHQECLQDRVGEPRAGAHEVDHPLQVVDEDDGQGRLVAIVEDLRDVRCLRHLHGTAVPPPPFISIEYDTGM